MQLALILIFAAGYIFIIFEHLLKLNKAASAVITGVVCWSIYILLGENRSEISEQLMAHTGDISAIIFFLLGAMTIVESMESHNGFDLIKDLIRTQNRRKLLWIISLITFFLSAILDNLTTTIVMVMLAKKLIPDQEERFLFTGAIVIAANAGGAWSPIGDVTTTMLWIAQCVTSKSIITSLLLPSLTNLIAPLIVLTFITGRNKNPQSEEVKKAVKIPVENKIILFSGIALLISVPIFKTITHLPPYMGMLFALGIMWIITEIVHIRKTGDAKYQFSILSALRRLDITTLLFFLGILLAVSSLQSSGILGNLAKWLSGIFGNMNTIAIIIGIVSAFIDNVPLVAGAIGMYPLSELPTDHSFWELLAYTAGTGGSILIIGSAAGVAAMGLEQINFFKYLKKIGWLALIGYFAGVAVYLLQSTLIH